MIETEPPAATRLPPLDRRSLLKGGGLLGTGFASVPLSAHIGGEGFTHGVASGEPGPDRVLLWTRFAAAQETELTVELSDAQDFRTTMGVGLATASPDRDFCAKTVVDGLESGTWYYYRFHAPDGSVSDIGRTRTLPEGPTNRFRMAVFSCANLGFGWFNAYAHAAEADDVDLVVHTGDYLYEYAQGSYPSEEQRLPDRLLFPAEEIVALADYRLRYATYRADRDLRRLHQLFPMIAGWDDHESANDSWKGGAENHQPATEGPWDTRKAAAIRAYREWMPVSDTAWQAYEIGDLATLFRLETRLEARSRPPSFAAVLHGKSSPDEAMAALAAFRDTEYADPAREMLGAAQEVWLADGLKRSKSAGKTWQVLAQQVLMGTLSTPVALVDALTDEVPAYVRQRLSASALAARSGLPFNMDAWDGYPAARARVFEAALAADADLISLAGDTHNAWASSLAHNRQAVGVEFGGQSVTSPGFEAYLGSVPPERLAGALVEQNDQLSFANTSQRGYMAVTLTPERAMSEYRFLSGIRQRGTRLAGTHTVATSPGRKRLQPA